MSKQLVFGKGITVLHIVNTDRSSMNVRVMQTNIIIRNILKYIGLIWFHDTSSF